MKRTFLVLALVGLLAACGGDEASDADAGPPDAAPPGGTISLSWTINGGASTCADVGAQLVVLELLRQGEGAGEVDTFNCTAGQGTTRQLKVGTYDVTIDLLNSSAASVLDAPIEETDISVTANSDSDLGAVDFNP